MVYNVVLSGRIKEELLSIEREIRQKLAEYSFPLKDIDSTTSVLGPTYSSDTNPTQLLGLIWDKEHDSISSNWKINLHQKNRAFIAVQT